MSQCVGRVTSGTLSESQDYHQRRGGDDFGISATQMLGPAHVGWWKYEPAPNACVFILVEPRSDLSGDVLIGPTVRSCVVQRGET
jgi:hypothetical protein